MGVFTIIVLSALVSILWLPAVLCALVLKHRFGAEVSRLLWLVLPSQLLIAFGLVFLAQYIGLLNPAGYVLGITVLVSLAGAIVVVLCHSAANPSFKRDCGIAPMEIKIHPTHAENTKQILVGLGVIAISGWATGMLIGQHGKNPEMVNILAFIVVASGLGIFITALLRAILIQCPACKKLLTKQVLVNKSTETRKFCCKRCNVIWDSRVQYEFSGD